MNLEGKKALLFDCDGTLAHTMPAHKKAYELAFNFNSVPFYDDLFDEFAPLGGEIFIKRAVEEIGCGNRSADIIIDKQKFLPLCLEKFMIPNMELIKLINETDLVVAVVSNGRRNSIMTIIDLLGINPYIKLLVAKEDTSRAKPYPDPYYYAMKHLKVEPYEVIVFEDNDIGITSARNAGIEDIEEVTVYEKI